MHGPYFKRLCSLSKELRRYANEEKKGKSYSSIFVVVVVRHEWQRQAVVAAWQQRRLTTKVYRIVKLLLLQLTVPNGSPGWME